ncbi:MAG: helix-turn-helix transcriptional regulator [Bacteroidota bacterium]
MAHTQHLFPIRQVRFENKTVPESSFDMISLEELIRRETRDELGTIHRVDFYILLLITEGKGHHRIDFTDYPYEKGSLITVRKDQIQRFSLGGAKGYLMFFKEDFIVSYLEKQESLKTIQLFNEMLGRPIIHLGSQDYTEVLQVVQYMKQEYFQVGDTYSLGILRSLLHILITKLYRAKSERETNLSDRKYLAEFVRFQELVETHSLSSRKVQDYADQMGVTPKTLNNIVRSIVNKSAKTFIDEIVILQIKRMLVNSSLSVKEIAYSTGFEEPTNLYKYFKKYTLTSPEMFRKSHS